MNKNIQTLTKFRNMNRVSGIQNFIIIACGNYRVIHSKGVVRKIYSKFISFLPVFGLLLVLSSCGSMGKKATNETATRGNIRIIADESF
jgi:hypothetical protein